MKFINADKLHRKSGGVGYHCSQPLTLPLKQQRTLRFVVSHISRKTSEIWGTQGLRAGKIIKRSSGFPRISCAACDFGALHAAFLKESRTRGPVQCSMQEIRVALSFSAHVRRGERGAPVHLLRLWFEWKSPEWREL